MKTEINLTDPKTILTIFGIIAGLVGFMRWFNTAEVAHELAPANHSAILDLQAQEANRRLLFPDAYKQRAEEIAEGDRLRALERLGRLQEVPQ